jgi:hypothetical protein
VSSRWCPNLIDLFNVSFSAGGAAEGSQGQARSEAERAAPGSSITSLRALKGRQKVGEDYCRNETQPAGGAADAPCLDAFSHCILSVLLSPFQGLVSITLITRGKRAALRSALGPGYLLPGAPRRFVPKVLRKKIRSRAFVSQRMHSDSQNRTLLASRWC